MALTNVAERVFDRASQSIVQTGQMGSRGTVRTGIVEVASMGMGMAAQFQARMILTGN
jgi:hypothetical protein